MRTNPLLIFPLAACIAMTGCGKKSGDQSTGENTGAADRVEINTDQGTIKAASGTGVAIPADFPKDVYVYTGAKVVTSMTMPQGHMLNLETGDPVSKVADAYRKEMTSAGWKQEMAMDSGDGTMLSYAKGNFHAQVTISSDGDNAGTTISLMASGRE